MSGMWAERPPAAATLATLLDLAAGLYLREPTGERLALCREVGGELRRLLPDPALGELFAAAAEEEVAAVRQEFFDLFLVPFSARFCPPFEGAQREGSETGPAVAAFFQAAGFSVADLDLPPYLRGMERHDHLGFQMAFLAGLFLSAAEAEDQEALLATAHRFHLEHGGWAGAFGRRLEAKAESSFCKALGLLTTRVEELLDLFFLSSCPRVPGSRSARDHQPLSW